MITVAKFSMPAEAHIAMAKLTSAGIPSFLKDESVIMLDWTLSNALGGLRLQVHEDDYEDACALLASKPDNDGLIVCPKCGSGDCYVWPLSPVAAALMIIKVPVPVSDAKVTCRACQQGFSVSLTPPSVR